MTEPDFWTAVRARLERGGLAERAVVLPGEDLIGWEGALVVGREADATWTVSTVDYGTARVLLRRPSAEEIASALEQYALSDLPPARTLTADEREELLAARTSDLSDLAARVRDGGDLLVDVPAGVLLDRIGALDGYRLYPSGTSFEARALPPDALRQPLHTVVTTTAVRMRVGVTPPWFGQPGGGLRFEIENHSAGLRDLVRDDVVRLTRTDDF